MAKRQIDQVFKMDKFNVKKQNIQVTEFKIPNRFALLETKEDSEQVCTFGD